MSRVGLARGCGSKGEFDLSYFKQDGVLKQTLDEDSWKRRI